MSSTEVNDADSTAMQGVEVKLEESIEPSGGEVTMDKVVAEYEETDEEEEDNPGEPSEKRSKSSSPFSCPLCREVGEAEFQFKSKTALSDHVIKIHMKRVKKKVAKEKPSYPCIVCADNGTSAVFEARSRYQAHLVSEHHTYVFMCDVCPLVFKLKANYKTHVKSHNLPVNKPFKCGVCKGSFVNQSSYDQHRKRFPGPHVRHICPDCGFGSSKTNHIVNHRCKKKMLSELQQKKDVEVVQESVETVLETEEKPLETEEVKYAPLTVKVVNPITLEELISDQLKSSDPTKLVVEGAEGDQVSGPLVQVQMSGTSHQVYQVSVADWNIVAPFVIQNSSVSNVVNYYPPT